MLLNKGQKGIETVIIKGIENLNEKELAEYRDLEKEVDADIERLFKESTDKAEFQNKMKDSDKRKVARMFELLENAK